MYKLSVPVSIDTIDDSSVEAYIAEFKNAKVDRVFLLSAASIMRKDAFVYTCPEKMERLIARFKEAGFEVGVWLGAFGHGGVLAHDKGSDYVADFTRIRGSDGGMSAEGFCPLDENFQKCYYEGVKKVALMRPDIIMFDDDFRLNGRRGYTLGCCCDKHMERFCTLVGENVPREKMEELVFTGGQNKYRDAWLKLSGDTLLEFARLMRRAVDEADESIRLGSCACPSVWDGEGTDMIALAKAFAGKTKPYMRTVGAPYHGPRVQNAVERTRMQAAWCEDEGIEIFAEGDVYPRPRYAVGSRLLEIYDNALVASGAMDGILKYMYDYNYKVSYEKGYNARHIKNMAFRDGIRAMFENKKHIGVRVYEHLHKVREAVFPKEYVPGASAFAWDLSFAIAHRFLCENAIPTVYRQSEEYPVLVFSENARHIDLAELKNGAILDVAAAKILSARGVDVGLISAKAQSVFGEYFSSYDDEIRNIASVCTQKAAVSDKACVKSVFTPDNTPASYTYENENGQRFYVLCFDAHKSESLHFNYVDNYYRQADMIEAIEWLCGRKLPAVCTKNPYLYMQAARGEDGALTVALFNMHIDEIVEAEIELDDAYSEIKCLGCAGTLCKNKVKLTTEIEPYGTALFEVLR